MSRDATWEIISCTMCELDTIYRSRVGTTKNFPLTASLKSNFFRFSWGIEVKFQILSF